MTKIRKNLLNPWIVGIGSTVISAIVLEIIAIIIGTNMFNLVLKVVFKGVQFILGIFNFKISLGIILICGSLIFLFRKWLCPKIFKDHPKYLDYIEDTCKGILYRWKYAYINGEYKIGQIVEYCPTCKCRIVHDKCMNCEAYFIERKDRQQQEAMIRYRIETRFQINEFQELGK